MCAEEAGRRPNVIFILTDDQGYPDLGCHGNPWLHTPHLDTLARESVRFDNFHVQPLCTPTRGALMTGRNPVRNGAWGTAWGNSFLHSDERTLADYFQAAGYRTGLFGKWHLGDQEPYRPWDRGFDTVVAHKGGGVGQTSDFWGNNYFDDTYFHNGTANKHQGYCTDVWFDEAQQFIEANKQDPFFVYLATNAPHSPYRVEEHWSAPYAATNDIPYPGFYGMIRQLDHRIGRLREFLKDHNLSDNTLLIFMTDNGTSGGCQCDERGFVTQGFNAGMRGKKASYYDGGHRVACMMHHPSGGLDDGRQTHALCCDVDILPTLKEYCDLPDLPHAPDPDGMSLCAHLTSGNGLPERTICLNYHQGPGRPQPERGVVMRGPWRMVHSQELYHIDQDPEQRRDIAAEHPQIMTSLQNDLQSWWQAVAADHARAAVIPLGLSHAPVQLDAMDLHGDIAWHQAQVAAAVRCSGHWTVAIAQPGRYQVTLRRWPAELDLGINADLSLDARQDLVDINDLDPAKINPPGSLQATRAGVNVGSTHWQTAVGDTDESVTLVVDLASNRQTTLSSYFQADDAQPWAPYFVSVQLLAEAEDVTGTEAVVGGTR
jgi:arylsulfatase A-like enzyme